jgi:FkbM family methyltransferase
MDIRSIVKNSCPPIIWNSLRYIRSWINEKFKTKAHVQIFRLKTTFDDINKENLLNEITIRPNITLKIHPDSRIPFEYFCFRSPECVEELDAFLNYSSDCKRLLDIGALHGIFALTFASISPDRRVIAIDASPLAYSKLLYNVHKNQPRSILPIECALTDCNGIMRMHYESEHAVSAGTCMSGPCIEIEAYTGDYICSENNFIPDAIKIDVEGHEVKVIRGLMGTLKSHKPLIFLEVHPKRIMEEGESMKEFISLLANLGYSAKTTNGMHISLSDLHQFENDFRILLSH